MWMRQYLAALDRQRLILWFAFLWFVTMAFRYAGGDVSVWLRSFGIAAIVGSILTLNATPPAGRLRDLGFWPVLRFFLIPACVASFSSFAKGHPFSLIFPLNLKENMMAGIVIAGFGGMVWLAKRGAR